MSDALLRDLVSTFGPGAVSSDDADRSAYAHDLWPRRLIETKLEVSRPQGPSAVVWPRDREQLSTLVTLARRHGISLLPFGAGSGVVGAISAGRDTVAVDLKRMRTLHSVDIERGTCVADVGVLGEHLEEQLRRRGATLGHFPSSIYCSTLGGWVATRGAGQCSGRYGKIEDMTLSLDGVMATGEHFTAAPPRPGEVDHRALMVGSEGLYGFITRCTMRVWPAPTVWKGVAYTFRDLREAFTAMRAVYQSGLRPAVSRLYDPFDTYVFLQGAHKTARAPTPETPSPTHPWADALLQRMLDRPRGLNALLDFATEKLYTRSLLLLVFEGTEGESMAESEAQARALCVSAGGRDEGETPWRRWLLRRHAVSYRAPGVYARGLWVDTMEVAAPWSKLEALHEGVRGALGGGGIVMAHMSHAYPDGCSIYFTFAGTAGTPDETLNVYDSTWQRALAAAHHAGGTVAHHHGVGRSKRGAMGLEWAAGVKVLEALRRAADPDGVMLRGAIIPAEGDAKGERPAATAELTVDRVSRTLTAPLDARCEAVSVEALRYGLRFDAGGETTVREWLRSLPTTTLADDPVDHPVAGWQGRLPNGEVMGWLPCPRRSAGPDLLPLLLHDDRFGALDTVTLRVYGDDETGRRWIAPCTPPSPSTDEGLGRWVDRAAGVLGEV